MLPGALPAGEEPAEADHWTMMALGRLQRRVQAHRVLNISCSHSLRLFDADAECAGLGLARLTVLSGIRSNESMSINGDLESSLYEHKSREESKAIRTAVSLFCIACGRV